MAFYSTHPFDHLIGPGIGRAEYGGLLMTLPPRRLYDVWSDPDYDTAETKAERLLMAGLDYAIERNVVYIAAKTAAQRVPPLGRQGEPEDHIYTFGATFSRQTQENSGCARPWIVMLDARRRRNILW